MLCEFLMRLEAVGLVKDNAFRLPITQIDLADTVGITNVHANRMLTNLRDDGLIEINSQEMLIKDVQRLKKLAGLNPNYLHLKGGKIG